MTRSLQSMDSFSLIALACLLLMANLDVAGQMNAPQGHSVGKVSTNGDLIVLELDEGALGKSNLFDLVGRTLRFTPAGSQYRVASEDLSWQSDFGAAVTDHRVTLQNFEFPFSGEKWKSFEVGTGWIAFRRSPQQQEATAQNRPAVSIGRFEPLAEGASSLINAAPAICVFFKPRMSGPIFAKESNDAIAITWELTEPFGNIQDFTWFKTTNLFQAVLRPDGTISMSYKELAARDAIVGVYPELPENETALAIARGVPHFDVPAHLDLQGVKVSLVGGTLLRVTLQARGPIPPNNDTKATGFGYEVSFRPAGHDNAPSAANWFVERVISEDSPTGKSGYFVFGAGASRKFNIDGNRIVLEGTLPTRLWNGRQVEVAAESMMESRTDAVVRVGPQEFSISSMRNPEVHLSGLTPKDGPFPLIYEAFHYGAPPTATDLSCTVIKALGDKFDFLAYYSDFRIDNQEAGTPSDGPQAGGVTGIGVTEHDLNEYCSKGRFQWGYVQPVHVGANQMQQYPPEGAPAGTDRDITFYQDQLRESTPEGKMLPYNYAMSQLGHEMGHRWAASASAKVHGEKIPLGPVHWSRGLQAAVPFPYQRPTEASAMGGGVWQDNLDGTFTQLDDDYYVPATGYSYLDLYLMGLISPAEVPDFFLLRNLTPAGKDESGRAKFKADRTKITIQEVIAAEGPRLPDVAHSQRKFNTGMVLVVEHGGKPSAALVERVNGIRSQWIEYWSRATGHRASMTATPQ